MTEGKLTKSPIYVPFKYYSFLVLLYIFIYNPSFSFLPVSPLELLLVPALLFIGLCNNWAKLLYTFKYELSAFALILIFNLLRELGSGGNIFFRANIFLLLQSIIFPYCIILLYSQLKNHNNLLKDIIVVGSIASFITLLMIFVPSLADTVRYKLLETDDFTELVSFRSFGISDGLTFGYGIAQGIIFALAMYYSKQNLKYLPLLIFLLISVLFNARIGLFPIALSLVYFLILEFNIKLLLIILGVGTFVYLMIFCTDFFSDYARTIEWAFDFFTQSSDFVSGNAASSDSNTFNTLFSDMAILPHNLREWIIGTGENVFVSPTANSDIGYIIQLYYGGISYILLFTLLIGGMMTRLRFLYKKNKWLIIILLVTLIVTNLKGLTISMIPSFRLIMLIYCYLIIEYVKRDKQEKKDFDLISFQ